MTNHIERTKEMIAVMQAYVDGDVIEYTYGGVYAVVDGTRAWDSDATYRIRETPDEIDWSHVAPEFKWMARDESGRAELFQSEPKIDEVDNWWRTSNNGRDASAFSSYKRGTVSWDKSLVKRPDGV